MSEEQKRYEAGEFINPATFHARTCRCDACVEYWERQQVDMEPAKKYDKGKLRYDLLPPDVLAEVVRVMTDGAEKYGDRNWEKGMSWGRVFGAGMRHAWRFWRGETVDPESGRPHLAHAIVNMVFLLSYSIRGVGTDDRSLYE